MDTIVFSPPIRDTFYYSDGTISDHLNTQKVLHRIGGPAVEWSNGDTSWFINGKHHREDGPAVENSNPDQWYYHGKQIDCKTNEEFLRLLKLKAFW